jgi:hypothetical protein
MVMKIAIVTLIGIMLCATVWAQNDTRPFSRNKTVTTQRHTGKEIKRWLELNPQAPLEEIERKVKDMEIQQPYVSRPVIKMKESILNNIQRQYPQDTETEEYLVIVMDSGGSIITDIRYEPLATVFPLDVYIV